MIPLTDTIILDHEPVPNSKSSSSPQIQIKSESPLTNEHLATILKADIQSRNFLLKKELANIDNGCLASIGIHRFLRYLHINRHESTVKKIQEFADSLPPLGNILVNFSLKGEELCNLDLTQTVRSSILKSTNASQLMQLLRNVTRNVFEKFCSDSLTDSQEVILSIFADLENMTIQQTKTALLQLKDFVRDDASLWDEIIDALEKHCKHIPKIKETLLQISRELRFYGLRSSIYIRIMSPDYQNNFRLKANIKKFQNIPYFDNLIEEARFIGDTNANVILENREKKKFDAWVKLITFINTNDISLDNESAITLLPLAKALDVKECVIVCYEHLWKNRYAFNKFFFVDFMLKHKTPYVRNIEIDILQLFQTSLQIWAYNEIEKYLEYQEIYSLQIDLKEEIRRAIKDAEAKNLKEFYPLYNSRPYQRLFPIVRSILKEKTNPPNLSKDLVINETESESIDNQRSNKDEIIEILDVV